MGWRRWGFFRAALQGTWLEASVSVLGLSLGSGTLRIGRGGINDQFVAGPATPLLDWAGVNV